MTEMSPLGTCGAPLGNWDELGEAEQLVSAMVDRAPDLPGSTVLETTWRMHPDVCAFVSQRSYDSRLRSRAHSAARRVNTSPWTA